MSSSPLDDEVMRALIEQVSKAVPEGGSEHDVLTIITRPMWEIWCRAVGFPIGCLPLWPDRTVYGSVTLLWVGSGTVESGSIGIR